MTLPYETATSGKNAIAEMQRILRAFGATSFGVMEDFAGAGLLLVSLNTARAACRYRQARKATRRHGCARIRGRIARDAHSKSTSARHSCKGKSACTAFFATG
jgi:hypothetical protein